MTTETDAKDATDEEPRRRRDFLKFATGAAAAGGAATLLGTAPAGAVDPDLQAHIDAGTTVDQLGAAVVPLTGLERIHVVQGVDDLKVTLNDVMASRLVTPSALVTTTLFLTSNQAWVPGVTHVQGSEDTTIRTLTLPHFTYPVGNQAVPTVRIAQMGAAKISIVAGSSAVVVSKASSTPASVRTSVRYGGVTAEALIDFSGTTIWLVSGDIEIL